MKLKLFYILLMSCFFSFQAARANTDTLLIQNNFKERRVNSYFSYFNTNAELTPDSAWKVFQQKPTSAKPLDKINFGPIHGFYWVTLTVKNIAGQTQNLFLEIRQPHIVQIIFYRVLPGSLSAGQAGISALYETGIQYDFYKRPLPHRYFDFPITCPVGESYTMLLKIYQVNSLSLPLHILTEDELHRNNYNQNILWGYWFGFLSFCALFAFIASILLRKSVFLWYFLYILSAALYGFTELGYGFQFFFPGLSNFEAPAIIHLSAYVFIFLIKFSQGLLETKKHLPLVHRTLNGIFYFMLFFILVGYALDQKTLFRYSPYILPLLNSAMLLGLLLLAFSGIKSLFTNRIVAVFYLLAYGTLVVASVFVIFYTGFGLSQYFGPNPILLSFFLEAMLLSVALVILFRQIQKDRTELMVKISIQQKQMYQQYIEGIEKERSRIAGELHDDIGSRLSHLKRGIQQSAENSSHQLDEIIQDIRQLSHDLAPPSAHISGMMPLIEKLIVEARKTASVDIKLQRFDYQERLQPNQIQQVYRILQELIHNITNHSKAGRADIQLFGYEDHLNITVEDDGVGFDIDQHQGFGINQIKVRTESLGGSIEINSRPGKGTQVLIEIPYTK